MLFNTPVFLLFFLIVTAVLFLLPARWQKLFLLAASYVFYLSWDLSLLWLIILVTLSAYACARLMERFPAGKKAFLGIGLAIPLLVLFFFKYFDFFASGAAALAAAFTGKSFDPALHLLVPVGISFYTFQALSYVIDVYRGDLKAETDPVLFALYIGFFPQLVAGPIERAGDLIPQLKKEHRADPADVSAGFKLMLLGYFEKIAVADVLGLFVNRIWDAPGLATGADALLASLFFSLQILCDFKGYSDIARGIARVYGIRLSENFREPYRAVSVSDFWRRWHITLSSWFRDYLYIPLGGRRRGTVMLCLNLLIVFAVSGLWHGAGLTFLLWGVLHGLARIAEELIPGSREKIPAVLRRAAVFLFVTAAWILFRAPGLQEAGLFMRQLFTGWNGLSLSASVPELAIFALSAASWLILPRLLPLAEGTGRGRTVLRWGLYLLLGWLATWAFLFLRSRDIASSFIYFQF
ncbi:MAG: MBOAT family protein [Lachnospiraceae bacterium]|nr:MBOAT family protein [Lachnospiraceae bacterium]